MVCSAITGTASMFIDTEVVTLSRRQFAMTAPCHFFLFR
jgi:hypothetical protein